MEVNSRIEIFKSIFFTVDFKFFLVDCALRQGRRELTFKFGVHSRFMGSKLDQHGDVESLSDPFQYVQGGWGVSWVEGREIAIQLHRASGFSVHLWPLTLNTPCWT